MYLVTAAEMRECDRRTIQRYTPGPVLMERAAYGIFTAIRNRYDRLNRRRIVIVCGLPVPVRGTTNTVRLYNLQS